MLPSPRPAVCFGAMQTASTLLLGNERECQWFSVSQCLICIQLANVQDVPYLTSKDTREP